MSETSPITGELSNSKLAAVFPDERTARSAAQRVSVALSLGSAQVQIITPNEPHPGRKLEPENQGIWRTIIVAHMRFGILGLFAGLLLCAALYSMGVPFIVMSPIAAGLALLFFGAVAGLMLGGLVALRPDHDRYVEATRDAMADGKTTVVVHAFSAEQRDQAANVLRELGGELTSTL